MRRYRTRDVTDTNEPTWLMWPWWVKIPNEDFTIAIDDSYGDYIRGGDGGGVHEGWQGGQWGGMVVKMEVDKVDDMLVKISDEDY